MKTKVLLFIFIVLTKFGFAQITRVTEWGSEKKLVEINYTESRNWINNEIILTYKNGIFSDPKTGNKLYELNTNILYDAKTGTKLYEYVNGNVKDALNGKILFKVDRKIISDAVSGKKILGINNGSDITYRVYFILLSTGYLKGSK